MIASKRSPSHISYQVNLELAPCFSSPADLLASPPTTPPRTHKHALSKPMSWLSRTSSSASAHSTPHAAPKPKRISEPKVGSSLDQIAFQRSGPLGSGATIVRTPQEAIFGPPSTFEQTNEKQETERGILLHSHAEESEDRLLPPLSHSPPLPPLPDISDAAGEDEGEGSISAGPESIPSSDHTSPPRPPDSPKTQRSSPQPTVQAHSRPPSRSIPPVPTETDVIPSQPSFEAILLSPVPDGSVDPSKFIIALETCTTTYRTSLRTLLSRPSHLSRYITSLLSPASETTSVYSNASDASMAQYRFNTSFRDHLASSGCLPQSSNVVHIFLDRPSAPYAHVLAYLRSLPGTPERPETLPRAVLLGSQSPSRLECLLDLCDEASFLGLDALSGLCHQEINRVQRMPLSTCLGGGGMLRGKTGSVRSFRTVIERCQPHQDVGASEARTSTGSASVAAKPATRESSLGSSRDKDLLRERSKDRTGLRYEVGSPPPGWI